MDKLYIGKKIKSFRKQRGITQCELAELVGIHEKQMSRIENGVNFPTFDNFIKIISILKMSFSDFDNINSIEDNSLKAKAHKIINRANDKEIKCYVSILDELQKAFNS
ncbi:MAG: helix-turn-helix domain-containing protein [Clostridiaceae bacterium]|nr:helix-turn-helix domain-containing protein [Clostridiaceae bacterium]